jgi:hypothetical protein
VEGVTFCARYVGRFRGSIRGMNDSAYKTMLESLGFTTVERGRKLQHASGPPTLYFNRKRNGDVYFTGYQADRDVYTPDLWRDLAPQQSKDAKPELITLLPVENREREAFRDFIARSKMRSQPESGPKAKGAVCRSSPPQTQ